MAPNQKLTSHTSALGPKPPGAPVSSTGYNACATVAAMSVCQQHLQCCLLCCRESRVINYAVTGSVSKVLEDLNNLCLGRLKERTQYGVAAAFSSRYNVSMIVQASMMHNINLRTGSHAAVGTTMIAV